LLARKIHALGWPGFVGADPLVFERELARDSRRHKVRRQSVGGAVNAKRRLRKQAVVAVAVIVVEKDAHARQPRHGFADSI
jgi:hypothetical protein